MPFDRMRIAAASTVAALGVLAAVALNAGGEQSPSQPAAAPKPEVRTEVVRRTVRVTRKQPKSAPAPARQAAVRTAAPRTAPPVSRAPVPSAAADGGDGPSWHGGGGDDHSDHGRGGDDDHSGHGGGSDDHGDDGGGDD
jgi:hypothetical protein